MCVKLVTKERWLKLSPKSQGYVLYMQSELPESELKGLGNPYAAFMRAHRDFQDGENEAILEAQDADE